MKRFAILLLAVLALSLTACSSRDPQAFLFQRGQLFQLLLFPGRRGGLLQFQRTGGGRARGGTHRHGAGLYCQV